MNLCTTNFGIILTAMFVAIEILAFIAIHHQSEINRVIGEPGIESKVEAEIVQYRIIIGMFLTEILIFIVLLLFVALYHEMRLNIILNDDTPNIPMDIETGFETRNTRERITASHHLCDNA